MRRGHNANLQVNLAPVKFGLKQHWQDETEDIFGCHSQSGRGTRNAKKPLNGFQGCHENLLNESCEMSPHLICLGWHIIPFYDQPLSRPDPEAGHKRDLGCQPRPIKWVLISQLSFGAFSWHPQKRLKGFFVFRVPLPDWVACNLVSV